MYKSRKYNYPGVREVDFGKPSDLLYLITETEKAGYTQLSQALRLMNKFIQF